MKMLIVLLVILAIVVLILYCLIDTKKKEIEIKASWMSVKEEEPEIKPKVIGMAYVYFAGYTVVDETGNVVCSSTFPYWNWHNIVEIVDEVDGNIKVKNALGGTYWVKKDQYIKFDELAPYRKQMEDIEKRYDKLPEKVEGD